MPSSVIKNNLTKIIKCVQTTFMNAVLCRACINKLSDIKKSKEHKELLCTCSSSTVLTSGQCWSSVYFIVQSQNETKCKIFTRGACSSLEALVALHIPVFRPWWKWFLLDLVLLYSTLLSCPHILWQLFGPACGGGEVRMEDWFNG